MNTYTMHLFNPRQKPQETSTEYCTRVWGGEMRLRYATIGQMTDHFNIYSGMADPRVNEALEKAMEDTQPVQAFSNLPLPVWRPRADFIAVNLGDHFPLPRDTALYDVVRVLIGMWLMPSLTAPYQPMPTDVDALTLWTQLITQLPSTKPGSITLTAVERMLDSLDPLLCALFWLAERLESAPAEERPYIECFTTSENVVGIWIRQPEAAS